MGKVDLEDEARGQLRRFYNSPFTVKLATRRSCPEKTHDEIAAETAAFLEAGGQIEKLHSGTSGVAQQVSAKDVNELSYRRRVHHKKAGVRE